MCDSYKSTNHTTEQVNCWLVSFSESSRLNSLQCSVTDTQEFHQLDPRKIKQKLSLRGEKGTETSSGRRGSTSALFCIANVLIVR